MVDNPLPASQLAERAPAVPAEALERQPLTAEVGPRQVAERRDRIVVALPAAFPKTVASLQSRFNLGAKTLFFIIAVVLPTLSAAVYYGAIASDQYVSEFRFGVRAADMMRNDASAIFQGMPSASQIGLDSNMVIQYIQSREMVADLQKTLDLRAIYSNSHADLFSRLDPKASTEDLVEYWRHKVAPFFDLTTGLISVQVKAFTPEDAQRVSNQVITLSENLVNDMSLRAREDAVKLNKDELADAEKRLEQSRAAMLAFRDKQSVVDASKETDARIELVAKMREELAHTSAELARLRSYLSEDSPSVQDLVKQSRAQQEQLTSAEARLTSSDPKGQAAALSASIGGYEKLEADEKFAQKYYDDAAEELQKSRWNADRQMSYLAVFVRPALAETALYPKRLQDVLIVFLISSGVWLLLLLAYQSIREHA